STSPAATSSPAAAPTSATRGRSAASPSPRSRRRARSTAASPSSCWTEACFDDLSARRRFCSRPHPELVEGCGRHRPPPEDAMQSRRDRTLISTEALQQLLGQKNVRIVDASWYMPAEKRDPQREYAQGHIPGAVYFDIDRIADRSIPLPHMFPSAELFAAE